MSLEASGNCRIRRRGDYVRFGQKMKSVCTGKIVALIVEGKSKYLAHVDIPRARLSSSKFKLMENRFGLHSWCLEGFKWRKQTLPKLPKPEAGLFFSCHKSGENMERNERLWWKRYESEYLWTFQKRQKIINVKISFFSSFGPRCRGRDCHLEQDDRTWFLGR